MVSTPKTVLVVEDEPLIRMTVATALTDAGFDVVEVDHADGALAVLSGSLGEVDLVFTDVNMPGTIDGLELAHRVQNLWPKIAVLIASGQAMLTPLDLPTGAHFLTKPYSTDQVVQEAMVLTSPA